MVCISFKNIKSFFVFESLANESNFDQIAYIKLLLFAAKKAKGVGYNSNSVIGSNLEDNREDKGFESNNVIGFNLEDIGKDKELKSISEDWLKEILPDICTIRKDNNEIAEDDVAPLRHNDWNIYRFVIKSDEFIKYINLENAARAQRTWRIATISIVIATASIVGSILKYIIGNSCT